MIRHYRQELSLRFKGLQYVGIEESPAAECTCTNAAMPMTGINQESMHCNSNTNTTTTSSVDIDTDFRFSHTAIGDIGETLLSVERSLQQQPRSKRLGSSKAAEAERNAAVSIESVTSEWASADNTQLGWIWIATTTVTTNR
jgi:hypothetical protein